MDKDQWFNNITAKVERPPTMKQIDYLAKLGYTGARPKTLKQASELISKLVAKKPRRRIGDEDLWSSGPDSEYDDEPDDHWLYSD